ncbi:MAG TPA: phosphatase PAP2 family protein [Vicinamibacterales bacterium]|jgi:undecaprenyl-diphosphatase|nr:phosphatase PAP2 family protein [Vicinamibacterales bacterium]
MKLGERLGLRKFERRELHWLLVGLGACLFVLLFWMLASEVAEGDTQGFDIRIVQALRNPANPSLSVGPAWLQAAMVDVTALGGPTILGLMLAAVVGFLLLQTRYHTALFVAATTASGEVLSYILKHTFNRARPSVVPNLRVMSPSFPSGHAMESAIVYLTLGAVLMRVAETRITKVYLMGVAMLLTTMVGISRVYLGVHYPTDVVGGWIVGLVWASICWLFAQHFEVSAGLKAEKKKVE